MLAFTSLTDAAWISVLTPMPILVPFACAAACLILGRRPRAQRGIALASLFLLTALSAWLLYLVDLHGAYALQMGGWDIPAGITLVADRLSTMMLTVSYLVLFAVMWFAVGQGIRDGDGRQPVSVFIPAYLLLGSGVSIAFLAGDLFNLYVGFEVLLVSSYVLLTLGATPGRVRAGVGYVMVSILSSLIFVLALAYVYSAVGTLNFAHISLRMADVPDGTRNAIFGVLLVAFGVKAAVWPLHSWLPDSYPTAPSLVTAVFAGLLTKVGVYSIIRLKTMIFPGGSMDDLLAVVAVLTMVIGIAGALAQSDIKRLLSFTLVSHIGYMIFGISLGNQQGMSGAIFYVAHHILVQTALFLVVGLIERQGGSSSLRRLGGLAKASPLLAVLYLVPALNLGGIPPMSGFIGKAALLQAAAELGSPLAWIQVAGAVVTSLLTLYAMMRVWSKAFWRSRSDAPEGDYSLGRPAPLVPETESKIRFEEREDVGRMPLGMVAPTALLVAASLGLTVLAGPLMSVTERAAVAAQDLEGYRAAVLFADASDIGSAPGIDGLPETGRTLNPQREGINPRSSLEDGGELLYELPDSAEGN